VKVLDDVVTAELLNESMGVADEDSDASAL
jgi:hypothetical protein